MARKRKPWRYRVIETALWADERYRRLSGDAKLLYLSYRTGPHTTIIPGLWRVGERAIAELLGWSAARFRKALRELERARFVEADGSAAVVYLPGVLVADPPDNPDVVRGWGSHWAEVPGCELKWRAWEVFRAHCDDRDAESCPRDERKSFVVAFRQACGAQRPDRVPQGVGHGDRQGGGDGVAHQEQEQEEQEQEQELAPEHTLCIDVATGGDAQGNGFRPNRAPSVTEVTRVAKVMFSERPELLDADSTEQKETLKDLCVRSGVPYDSDSIRKALDSQMVRLRTARRA